jgi:uncharacterized DUF497 family protein
MKRIVVLLSVRSTGRGSKARSAALIVTSNEQRQDRQGAAVILREIDYGEERFNLTGMADNRLLVVTYAQRCDVSTGDDVIRIISARVAERREAKRYHKA